MFYRKKEQKPYTIGLDAGHGGTDVGAIGYIEEVELTEKTADLLEELLKKDGHFEVVRSRKNGEDMSITKRKEILLKQKPDLILSILTLQQLQEDLNVILLHLVEIIMI